MTEKQKRGFALMDPAKRREIAELGGHAAHASGNAHQFTSAEARAAGQRRNQLRKNRENPSE